MQNFGLADAIEVALDRMLQTTCRDREFEGLLPILVEIQSGDQPGCKTISPSHSIDNVGDLVLPRQVKTIRIAQTRGPAVAIGTARFPQRHRDDRHVRKRLEDLGRQSLVFARVECAAFDIDVDVNVEALLAVFFIRDTNVDVLHQLAHDFGRRLAVLPQLASEIEIARHRQAVLFGGLACFEREIRRTLAQRRCNPRNVKPLRAFEDLGPVEVAGTRFAYRRVCTVVNHFRWPLVRPCFQEIHADALTLANDAGGIDTELAEFPDSTLGNVIVRQRRDESRIKTVVRQRNGYIGFTTTERCLQLRRLEEALVRRRLEPQHDLAEAQEVAHLEPSLAFAAIWIASLASAVTCS